jgi:O-antigen/teichoic acid export membrane protein
MGVVVRQSLKGTFVNYIGVVLGIFVQFYIVAKYLDPEVIGLSKVVYEVAFLLSSLALFGSGSTGMRFFPYFKDEETGNHGFLYYYLLFPIVGVITITLLYLGLREPIEAYFGAKSPLFNQHFYYVIPMMIVLAFWVWAENYANINMRIAVPKAVREIGMRLMMLLIYLAYGFGYIGVTGLIVGFIICYGICMIIAGVYSMSIGSRTLRHDWSFITPELRSKVLKYAGFLMLATISGNIIQQMDTFMLAGVKGLYSAGIYTIVIYMAEIVNMPSRNITPISTPLASQAMKDGNIARAQQLYRQVSVHQMLASAVLLMIVWINLDNIYMIIPNGEKFAEGRWAVLFLGLSKVVYGMLNFGNTLISFSKYYYWTLFFALILAAISIFTNLHFIPIYGLSGAALASLITVLFSYAYQQYIVQVKIKTNPFCWAHARIVVILLALFAVNWFIPSLSEKSPWLDGLVRTTIVMSIAMVLIHVLKISPQINWFINTKILRKDSK